MNQDFFLHIPKFATQLFLCMYDVPVHGWLAFVNEASTPAKLTSHNTICIKVLILVVVVVVLRCRLIDHFQFQHIQCGLRRRSSRINRGVLFDR